MVDIKLLEQKITELENRLKKLEDMFTSPASKQDRELMDELYKKAQELVIKNQNASIAFLQRKLWIDIPRTKRLLDELERNGVVGPATGAGPREILAKDTSTNV